MEQKDLFQKYKGNPTDKLRNQIAKKYMFVVDRISRRFDRNTPSSLQYDDIYQYGIIGLLKAIDRFDVEQGVNFKTFASYRIRGEILDGIRKEDWVPRLERSKGTTPPEMISTSIPVYNKDNGNPVTLGDLIPGEIPDDSFEDFWESLSPPLTDRERLVVKMYYLQGKTMAMIGKSVGLSESAISLMIRRAYSKLKRSTKIRETYLVRRPTTCPEIGKRIKAA